MTRRLASAGFGDLRPGHGCVMRFIDPEGSRPTELADRSGYTKQTVSEVAQDLIRLGYLERAADPDDGRAKILRLTSHGAHARETARELASAIERDLADRFGSDHMTNFVEILAGIASDPP